MKTHGRQRPSRVHFIGIGGTGMVAGARLAVEAGWEVRGSDNPLYPPASHMAAALGVPIATGYDAANLDWGPDVVVVGNALSRGNPEVEAVLTRRLRYVSLPEWLKEHVLRRRRPVAICGTHGKTTTTALTAWVLDRCGRTPGYLIGGQPLGFKHSARLGDEGAPFVIEGDEYDTAFFDKRAKFLHYLPEVAVVTSIEFDHGDIYRDLDEIELAFQRMLRQVPADGHVLVCADNAAAALRDHAYSPVTTYGFHENAGWRGEVTGVHAGMPRVRIRRDGADWAEMPAPLPGRHNVQNLIAAMAVAGLLELPPEAVAEAVAAFPGVRRRMEVFLEADGRTFVDDFAHHPTAIRETIAAARQRWPGRRLGVLFEPRSNTSVTNRFQDALCDAFAGADAVWLGPLHRAEQIDPALRLDRGRVTAELARRGVVAHWSDDIGEIVRGALAQLDGDAVVLVLSNGAFGGIYDRFRDAVAGDSL